LQSKKSSRGSGNVIDTTQVRQQDAAHSFENRIKDCVCLCESLTLHQATPLASQRFAVEPTETEKEGKPKYETDFNLLRDDSSHSACFVSSV